MSNEYLLSQLKKPLIREQEVIHIIKNGKSGLGGFFSKRLGLFEIDENGNSVFHLLAYNKFLPVILDTIFISISDVTKHDPLPHAVTLPEFLSLANQSGDTLPVLLRKAGSIMALDALYRHGIDIEKEIYPLFSNIQFFERHGSTEVAKLIILAMQNKIDQNQIITTLEDNHKMVNKDAFTEVVLYLKDMRTDAYCKEVFVLLLTSPIFFVDVCNISNNSVFMQKFIEIANVRMKQLRNIGDTSEVYKDLLKRLTSELSEEFLSKFFHGLDELSKEEAEEELNKVSLFHENNTDEGSVVVESNTLFPSEGIDYNAKSFANEVADKVREDPKYWKNMEDKLGPDPQTLKVILRLCSFGAEIYKKFIDPVSKSLNIATITAEDLVSRYIFSLSKDEFAQLVFIKNKTSKDSYSLACKYRLFGTLEDIMRHGKDIGILDSKDTELLIYKALVSINYHKSTFEYLIRQTVLDLDMHFVLLGALKLSRKETVKILSASEMEPDETVSDVHGRSIEGGANNKYTILNIVLLMILQELREFNEGNEVEKHEKKMIDLSECISLLLEKQKLYLCIDNPSVFKKTLYLIKKIERFTPENSITTITDTLTNLTEKYLELEGISQDQKRSFDDDTYSIFSTTTRASAVSILTTGTLESDMSETELGGDLLYELYN